MVVVALLTTTSRGQNVIRIDPVHKLTSVSRHFTGTCLEDVNHEVYGGIYSQMIFGESFQEPAPKSANPNGEIVSGMWRLFRKGTATGTAELDKRDPSVGSQSQRLTYTAGNGEVGIENRGLNRQGLCFIAHRPYEGHLLARSDSQIDIQVSLASADGSHLGATSKLSITGKEWSRYDFVLTPDDSDNSGQFEICLTTPGSVLIGYAFFEPGAWGTFHGLPVRKDVADALMDQGITVMRYGGSMVNAGGYRWKKMIGDRDRRPPYRGTWYRQSSNGWGIIDFLNLCEAAKFLPVPDFNINESASDMADFVEYVNGSVDTKWGHIRAADGHPRPYMLTHLELGNEERVDEGYCKKFEGIAKAIWARDPKMILTVGDFEYSDRITDPMHVTGATSKISSLSAHQKILQLAKQYDAEVWFDVHIWTGAPPASRSLDALPSYIDAIDHLADGAKHHVVVFELNANNHQQRRAIANAQAMMRLEKDGRLPVICSANCLQVDGQNDNGWDQGLLFVNPSQVWLQPPGYVLKMFSRAYQPTLVECESKGTGDAIESDAAVSDDGKTIVLKVVNTVDTATASSVEVAGWNAGKATIEVQTLEADPSAANSAKHPDAVQTTTAAAGMKGPMTFPPHSFTIIRWNRSN